MTSPLAPSLFTLTEFARQHRKAPTASEAILWNALRDRRFRVTQVSKAVERFPSGVRLLGLAWRPASRSLLRRSMLLGTKEVDVPSDTRTVVRLVSQQLVGRGYKKAKPNVFIRPTGGAGIVSWVGLNLAKRGDVVEVNPMIGVRHGPVEALVAELCEESDDHVLPPTAALNVGYLTPDHRYECFLFDGVRPDDVLAAALVDKVAGVAATFASENADVEGLVRTLTTKPLMPEQTAYRLPVALLLLGKKEEALAALDAKLRQIGVRGDPAAVRFRGFAERLRARI